MWTPFLCFPHYWHLRRDRGPHVIAKKTKRTLKALCLRIKCDQIIERQRTSVVLLAGEIDQLRGLIQETKFSQGESDKQVENC